MELATFLIVFAAMFLVGVPVAYAMIFSSWLYIVITGGNISFLTINMFTSVNSFTLVAIPMFLLTAEIMGRAKISDRLFDFANSIVGFIPGGLGHVNVVTSIIFSGMSGSAVSDVGGIGHMSCVAMEKRGFGKPFSGAVTAASACIGPIIPPSIPMVLYAMISGQSIGRLFIGGVLPGLLMGIAFMVVVFMISVKRKYPVEPRKRASEVLKAFVDSLLALFTPGILLGGIMLGIVTVTEAAVLAVVYSCAIGVLAFRMLGPAQAYDAVKSVFASCGPILILFPAARIFGFVLTVERIPILFAQLFMNIESHVVILLAINAMFLLLGMVSSATVNIMLFVPIVLPLAQMINIDPIHFGVMVVLNAMIGLITPPVGGLIFVVSGIEDIEYDSLVREIWPFVGILIVVLMVVTFYPPIVTYLPNLIFNR